jgi:hypothetical protein
MTLPQIRMLLVDEQLPAVFMCDAYQRPEVHPG